MIASNDQRCFVVVEFGVGWKSDVVGSRRKLRISFFRAGILNENLKVVGLKKRKPKPNDFLEEIANDLVHT